MEQTAKKKSINFGFRGWMLIIYLFGAFFAQVVLTNYPMNILGSFYGPNGDATFVPLLFTIGVVVNIIIQLIATRFIGKIKSIKTMSVIAGAIALAAGCFVAFLPVPFGVSIPWVIAFIIAVIAVHFYCTFAASILAGQWFPRRKGTVMGIATIAFPVGNGLISVFASSVFSSGAPNPAKAFLPFLIFLVLTWLVGLIFLKDYPEQVGAYRDNDKSFTPEMANKMMMEEIENKKTTVWTIGHTFACRDFWLVTIPCGLLLMFAVGTMTQSSALIGMYPELNFSTVMLLVMVFGILGSWLLGVIDTKIGTKKAMIISAVIMLLSGALGMIKNGTCLMISLFLLAIFMGASSNFTVSVAAQYWRREDFASVFAALNPIANIFNALAPTVAANLIFSAFGYTAVFLVTAIAGIISIIMLFIFSSKHIKTVDDKYRMAAGKPLDDALLGRK